MDNCNRPFSSLPDLPVLRKWQEVIKNLKGRRKINQESRERQTRTAESFAPPRIEIPRFEQLGALGRKKKATLCPIQIRTPRTAPGAALAWRDFLVWLSFAFSQ
ncbi:hypothetical protein AVEN_72873-1 [Araneus ventricosus]|uniref:Uncharacterized protein n=1 Tax=Araneus ventricosus TaxID=182803 RepID=A0A4Y2LUE0_ARAVE|nr:hypothetical protein AVEN_72873-1 [Araneus ventricosus]